ncbi:hypothetical protein [Azospirillum endophyticum]
MTVSKPTGPAPCRTFIAAPQEFAKDRSFSLNRRKICQKISCSFIVFPSS